jgi:hypothetical protein
MSLISCLAGVRERAAEDAPAPGGRAARGRRRRRRQRRPRREQPRDAVAEANERTGREVAGGRERQLERERGEQRRVRRRRPPGVSERLEQLEQEERGRRQERERQRERAAVPRRGADDDPRGEPDEHRRERERAEERQRLRARGGAREELAAALRRAEGGVRGRVTRLDAGQRDRHADEPDGLPQADARRGRKICSFSFRNANTAIRSSSQPWRKREIFVSPYVRAW